MSAIAFRVIGEPKGQPRPRAFAMRAKGGARPMIRVYDPGTAEGWKSCVAHAASGFVERGTCFAGPVAMYVCFIIARPKSHYRTGKNAHMLRGSAPVYPTGKPDVDNYAKAVMDALTTLGLWRDDAQVCKLVAQKVYGAQPGAVVRIADAGATMEGGT